MHPCPACAVRIFEALFQATPLVHIVSESVAKAAKHLAPTKPGSEPGQVPKTDAVVAKDQGGGSKYAAADIEAAYGNVKVQLGHTLWHGFAQLSVASLAGLL